MTVISEFLDHRRRYSVARRYPALIADYGPVLWLRFDETEGNIAHNSGTGGAALNATLNGVELNQPGAHTLTRRSARFDGIDDDAVISQPTTLQALTSYEIVMICRMMTPGEANSGRLYAWDGSTRAQLQADGSVLAAVNYSTSDAETTSEALLLGEWVALFFAFDPPELTLRQGYNGLVSSLNASVTAGVGDLIGNAGDLILANNGAGNRALDVYYDELMVFDGVLTPERRERIVQEVLPSSPKVLSFTTTKNGNFTPQVTTAGATESLIWAVEGQNVVVGDAPSFTLDGTARTVTLTPTDQYRSVIGLDVSDLSLAQGDVDSLVAGVYATRAAFTQAAKTLELGGSNAAPGAAALTQIAELEGSYGWTINHS